MSEVLQSIDGGVSIVSMQRPKANALNASIVRELQKQIDAAANDDGVRALVLASECPRFFSVGLDMHEVFEYSRDQMRDFWLEFGRLYTSLHELPKPTVAALNGHCMAGGLILALACDLRLAADYAATRIAVSGVNMGLALPPEVYAMAVQAMGHGHARHLFVTGESIGVERAAAFGLVRGVTRPGELRGRALEFARKLGEKHAQAYAAIKSMAREAAGYPKEAPERDVDAFLDHWFSEDVRAIREAAIAELSTH